MWLTGLVLMPSASATAMPLAESWGSSGRQAPWKSWLRGLRPLSECCPSEIFNCWGMQQKKPGHFRGRAYPKALRSGHGFQHAPGRGLHVGAVQREPGERDATDDVAENGRDLVPHEVVAPVEVRTHEDARGEQEHVHHRVL